jgi:hypothetical protein
MTRRPAAAAGAAVVAAGIVTAGIDLCSVETLKR